LPNLRRKPGKARSLGIWAIARMLRPTCQKSRAHGRSVSIGAAQLAVAADARPFAGPAAEPPRFRATLRVAQPRAEGRARLNCRDVSRTERAVHRASMRCNKCLG